jgi:predicted ATPase/DNA-binding SARP family transcriptional activator
MPLYFQALGPPRLLDGGEQIDLPPAWALLLLGFVINREEGVGRDEIVAHFWPEEEERNARHNLSQLLYRYRAERWLKGLEVTPRRLLWLGESDLAHFRRAVAAGEWQRAVKLHRGEFLAGVQAVRSVGVTTWLEEERTELSITWRDAVLRHAAQLSDGGRYSDAADALRSVLAADLLAEDVLHAYLQNALPAGRRAEALETYDAFCRKLREELDTEPLPVTSRLAEALRCEPAPAEDASQTAPRVAGPVGPGESRRGLPGHLVPFVGRDIELAELANTFENPDCRLLTITGPGGIGKSRIAVRVARELAGQFAGNVHFVPLASLTSEQYIAPAIAAALGFESSASDLQRQLVRHLGNEATLLILDNFEHLQAGAGLVTELLLAAPQLRTLVTSREPLGLHHEWCYKLGGLHFPAAGAAGFPLMYDAMQLFLASARRASSSFMLADTEKPAVARICRLLGGMPLGLELAGSWVRLLTPTELASELADNLDLLAWNQPDRPARHHSLRAVFEHSWNLLEAEERRALARLAVFRGGFDKRAAQLVPQASLKTLLSLVSKSLLGRTQDGRFELLETVRQYTHEKLALDGSESEAARQRHAEYYRDLAEQAETGLKGPEQAEWLDRLALERDNLRAALDWAQAAGRVELGLRLASSLQQFWWVRGPYDEGPRRIDSLLALPAATQLPALRAKALHRAGTLVQLQGDFDHARERYREALDLARELDDRQLMADSLHSLGLLAAVQGDPEAAFRHYEPGAALQRELDDRWGLSVTLNNMGIAHIYQGEYRQALPLLGECLEHKRELGDPQGIAYALNNLGTVHYWIGDLPAARRYAADSLILKEQLGDEQGIATSLANLGRIAGEEGDFESARGSFDRSIRRLAEIENHWTLLWVLTAVVKLEAMAGQPERALRLAGGSQALAEALGVALPAPNAQELAQGLALAERALPAGRVWQLLTEGRKLDAAELASYAARTAPVTP